MSKATFTGILAFKAFWLCAKHVAHKDRVTTKEYLDLRACIEYLTLSL
jgi:hypothetical protein